jgi:hypothetical protein
MGDTVVAELPSWHDVIGSGIDAVLRMGSILTALITLFTAVRWLAGSGRELVTTAVVRFVRRWYRALGLHVDPEATTLRAIVRYFARPREPLTHSIVLLGIALAALGAEASTRGALGRPAPLLALALGLAAPNYPLFVPLPHPVPWSGPRRHVTRFTRTTLACSAIASLTWAAATMEQLADSPGGRAAVLAALGIAASLGHVAASGGINSGHRLLAAPSALVFGVSLLADLGQVPLPTVVARLLFLGATLWFALQIFLNGGRDSPWRPASSSRD